MTAIRSMTGFGQGAAELPSGRVSVVLRSVNHRFADVRMRLPDGLAEWQGAYRRRIASRVRRGRVEVAVDFQAASGAEPRPVLNRALLDEVLSAAGEVRAERGVAGELDLRTVLGVPGMFRPPSPEGAWDEERRRALDEALELALQAMEADRLREGRHLRDELDGRVAAMRRCAAEVRERAAAMPATVRDRLLERLAGLAPEVRLDPGRVAQEAALQADRCDVTEEVVRLEGHLTQVAELLRQPGGEPVGKRLEFLLQEIHRETNTVNSKSVDLELSRAALALKGELEKAREQVQNLE